MANDPPDLSASFAEPPCDLTLDDDTLAGLARDCWIRAEDMTDPQEVQFAARAAVEAAVDFAARKSFHHTTARNVIRDFLTTKRRLLRRAANPFTNQLHRAIWLMAQRLFETSVYHTA